MRPGTCRLSAESVTQGQQETAGTSLTATDEPSHVKWGWERWKNRREGENRQRGAEDQERAWPKWQTFIEIRSWGKGREVHGLERFRVGDQVRRLRMPASGTLWQSCVMLREPVASMCYGLLMETTVSQLPWVSLGPDIHKPVTLWHLKLFPFLKLLRSSSLSLPMLVRLVCTQHLGTGASSYWWIQS